MAGDGRQGVVRQVGVIDEVVLPLHAGEEGRDRCAAADAVAGGHAQACRAAVGQPVDVRIRIAGICTLAEEQRNVARIELAVRFAGHAQGHFLPAVEQLQRARVQLRDGQPGARQSGRRELVEALLAHEHLVARLRRRPGSRRGCCRNVRGRTAPERARGLVVKQRTLKGRLELRRLCLPAGGCGLHSAGKAQRDRYPLAGPQFARNGVILYRAELQPHDPLAAHEAQLHQAHGLRGVKGVGLIDGRVTGGQFLGIHRITGRVRISRHRLSRAQVDARRQRGRWRCLYLEVELRIRRHAQQHDLDRHLRPARFRAQDEARRLGPLAGRVSRYVERGRDKFQRHALRIRVEQAHLAVRFARNRRQTACTCTKCADRRQKRRHDRTDHQ